MQNHAILRTSIRYNLYYEELDGVSEGMGFQERLGPNEWQWCDSLQNAEGKLLFHPFGGGNADSLIQQAADAGAIGLALVYPTNQDWETFVEIDATVFDIPVCKVADYNDSWMAEQAPKTLRVEAAWDPLGTEGEMSAFSSWGPTEALTLKPEITGIGGNVFSAHIGDQFAVMSGTSIASMKGKCCCPVFHHTEINFGNIYPFIMHTGWSRPSGICIKLVKSA